MIAMLRIPRINLDERRKRHLRRLWWHFQDNAYVTAWVIVALLGSVMFWMTFAGAEKFLRHFVR